MEARIPEEVRAAKADFVELLHERNFSELEATFAPEAWNEETLRFLVPFSEGFSAEPEYELKTGAYGAMAEGSDVYHTLGSQVSAGEYQHAFTMVFRERDGSLQITGATFHPLPGDLEAIHSVTLAGKGPILWIVFFSAFAIPIFVLWSAADCWRSKQRLRWLWIPIHLLCFPLLAVGWTSHHATLTPKVLLSGVDFFQPSRISEATIAIAPPIGAIAWQVWRRLRSKAGPKEPPADGVAS
ncbi:MAG: hypothetical protein JRG96_00880 [Deltaproteobacteria bacterium]|nr:hypothetical protein [Deltaproteobacteria bacterium]MBW2420335.1 hypothetical protein [Deltaproteobacteria bacterium]